MKNLKLLLESKSDEIEKIFIKTDILAIIIVDNDLKISECNKYFKKIISSRRKLLGESIYSFLLPESQKVLPISETIENQAVWLNFKTHSSTSISMKCHIIKMESGGYFIIGGHLMLTPDQNIQEMTVMSNEMANMARDLHRKNKELREAQSQIKVLSGIIPICMHCKEIRDDKGYWNRLENFISKNSEAEFSHGVCDKCLEKYYPDFIDD